MANFSADLGLDSLDQVELLLCIEEQFKVEIPEEEVWSFTADRLRMQANRMVSCDDAIKYFATNPNAK